LARNFCLRTGRDVSADKRSDDVFCSCKSKALGLKSGAVKRPIIRKLYGIQRTNTDIIVLAAALRTGLDLVRRYSEAPSCNTGRAI